MSTVEFAPGAPNWLDLGSPDVAASARFYAALFGWQYESAGPDTGGYGFFKLHDDTVAGIGPLSEEGAKPAWTIYFNTPDADATAKAVEQAGGAVRYAPVDVFTHGRNAGFTDPTGAQFAVWQPGDTVGVSAIGRVNTLSWTELYTTDATKAKAFYAAVFRWEAADMPMGGFTYTIVSSPGGGMESGHGGIMELSPDMIAAGLTSRWHPYFEVSDCDTVVQIATADGATVVMGPEDVEGVGRIAQLLDPHGAPFAVIKSVAPPEQPAS